ncbi:MAG: adenylosuccinate synthase [Paenibacillaceae bacterium]|jgi:adenylosuccinate synthase|nr:adenylosuccinate synthase [Paenibacillaceae bacterium]
MTTVVVVGTQWGDEGKGKVTDYLASSADVVARYQGGNNAGHTIMIENKKYALTLIPSGIFSGNKTCVIGNGVVVNPQALVDEIAYVQNNGFSTEHLVISDRAHVIMPYHMLLDAWQEEQRGDTKIGTTRKGIGPAYVDKFGRSGIRMCDLVDEKNLEHTIRSVVQEKNKTFVGGYGSAPIQPEPLVEQCRAWAKILRPYVRDASVVLNDAIDNGAHVLCEGAQGVMLDVDHGTYPYVTSSNPIAGGVCTGLGIGPTRIDHVIGVAKAYTTRVGDGPFPTELNNEIAHQIRERGFEYGTVTGRPRRIGWIDTVVLRHARRVSGITGLSLNSLDVLSGLDEVRICTHYECDGVRIASYPARQEDVYACTPVYETLPGWTEDITGVRAFDQLPRTTQQYVHRVCALSHIPLAMFSVGRNREQTHLVQQLFSARPIGTHTSVG